ncbi:glucosaminidase domain-containing protein [Candidatus Daviesbacteria bacterium]|nr:glucosaminidase domain-containing protein [Candidatus Daviesbacteria bacterium]
MTKFKFLAFFILTLLSLSPTKIVVAEKLVEEKEVNRQVEAKRMDNRAKILAQYLAKFNSPLQYHAQDLIDAADAYRVDWKLIPSIAGVESTFGKHIPGGFNAWGWGVYGTQAIYFDSWKDGIFTLAKGLREGYLDKGLKDPYAMNRIYAASPSWGKNVTFFMQDLEKFASEFVDNDSDFSSLGKTPNIAAVSGQLTLR